VLLTQNMAALILDAVSTEWTVVAGILAIIIGLSTISSALITGLLINPKLESAKKEIIAMMVSSDVFEIYTETDKREHAEMKEQLKVLTNRNRR